MKKPYNQYGHDYKYNNANKPPRDKTTDLMYPITVYLPQSVRAIMEEKAGGSVPISHLALRAIHNELESDEPFVLQTEWPGEPEFEHQYAHEAGLMFDYVVKHKDRGIALGHLIMFRRDYGIDSDERVYRAYQELLSMKMIELVYPRHTVFEYPLEFRHVRALKKQIGARDGRRKLRNRK